MGNEISFPRQQARTQRFTLGAPRTVVVSPDGGRVYFLRTAGGRANGLWVFADGVETLLVDPDRLLTDPEDLSPEERARRERSREQGAGIVGYATDGDVTRAAFTLSGRLFVVGLATGDVRELPTPGPVIDPRLDPTGRRVGYVTGGALHVVDLDTGEDRVVAEPDAPDVTWGLAEFIAAEEMSRFRGYWFSPDGGRVLAARVDNSPVDRWYIADPANPATPATEIAYPAAGTPNADVTVAIFGPAGRVDVDWDRAAFPYLTTAHWSAGGRPLLSVQSRDQRHVRVLAVDPDTGTTEVVADDTDPHWLEIVPGTPAWTPDGRLVRVLPQGDANRLLVGDRAWTPDGFQVRAVLEVTAEDVLVSASTDDPTRIHVFRVTADAVERLSAEDGVHGAARGGDTLVLSSAGMDHFGTRTTVSGVEIASMAEEPVLTPEVRLLTVGERNLRAALLFPRDHVPGTKLPVLLDPYGGPHAQRVLAARNAYLASQWLADQGFAVLVVDGRGTPGRGPVWEREIASDFAGATLDDQVDALHAVAATEPDLDTTRVGIRGWSYGGYLAALAVLRRPDVFHAGIAGAPVTDWRLYDTHYTERYLGHPAENPEVYDTNSLIADAPNLTRPLMIVHGLADDNVVAAHMLRLSSALLAAGRPHTVLPLSGVTHMTPQEEVAENLLLVQVDFLKKALA
ncbi:prolyl oligopeptidase family serine peptidase [Saccharothrix violaceirubra]|uniref:Dipeptidyl-peptidase-4 n=1 Tax=Saccharothrix violaceirubra TaxID=413306 RepID=A0A7W7WV67_9PSEU|nr:prolyl oligopeptidase family serine peptidase [Saccharothrix violaceirubra]MBB4964218.1 dipeptidyl-peptidase-4 [Saccharothrix violaceirubra]